MTQKNSDSANVWEQVVLPVSSLPKENPLRSRLELLRESFCTKFKSEPTLYLRAPGRVNLIGEHVDYCGYSVCPMALQQDVLVAFRPAKTPTFLSIINQDVTNYPDYATDSLNFEINLATIGWASYVLCGVRKIIELMTTKALKPVPMQMAISGNIPPSSGLSSSSSLVCLGVLATALANKLKLSKSDLASLSAEAEHYIGTVGGGMDQGIIFLASEGCAKLIEFNPLRTRDVMMPAGAVFVVAHSLITKNKAASNDFNTRVVECRLAGQILAKTKKLQWEKCLRLADFQSSAGLSLIEAAVLVREVFHEASYSKKEVCDILEVTADQLNKISLTPNTVHVQDFKLFQRAMHVFQEAERVARFEAGCRKGCALPVLGQLMSESHDSLQNLYQCSHPQLDRLVSVCMAAGALGARLTGAGWGGCVVALISENRVDKFIAGVKEKFYTNNPLMADQKMENVIFATQPGQGVQVFNFDDDVIIN